MLVVMSVQLFGIRVKRTVLFAVYKKRKCGAHTLLFLPHWTGAFSRSMPICAVIVTIKNVFCLPRVDYGLSFLLQELEAFGFIFISVETPAPVFKNPIYAQMTVGGRCLWKFVF